MGMRWTRTWAGRLAAAGIAGAAVLPTLPAGAGAGAAAALVAVVVDGTTSEATAVAVRAAGGEVDEHLTLIGAVTGHVPPHAVGDLRAAGLSVVPDASLRPVDDHFDNAGEGRPAPPEPESSEPDTDTGTGAGVGVALIDTGVADLGPLTAEVEHGKSFGQETGDGYGHGTFMAGLIARTAPDARIVSIKVADSDGSTSLGTLIEAIGWAVVHQDDPEKPFEVLNLSFGTVAPMGFAADPLVQAVEAAWASGLTVVVAAGNEGEGTVTSPGTSPSAITVGATNAENDAVADWSGRSRSDLKPEVVAPGSSIVSWRAPGSLIDLAHPATATDGALRGSGTSMSTALASGAAAVVLGAHPGAEPIDVKGALVDTADELDDGSWLIDLDAATSQTPDDGEAPGEADQPGSGRTDPTVSPGWEGSRWTGSRWTGSRWTGSRWTGSRWTEESWADALWSGSRWTGSRWTGSRWTGSRWTESEWAGSRWTGSRWTGSRWTMFDETS